MAFVDTFAFEESGTTGPSVAMVDRGRSVLGFVGLLPPGEMYGRTPDESPNLYGLCHGLSLEGERLLERADELIAARDPRYAYAFLPEYEEMLGLPDAASVDTSAEARRLACYERLTSPGNMSPDNLIRIGASLGYEVHVQFAMWEVWEVGELGCQVGETGCMVGEPWDGLVIHVVGGSNDAQLEASIERMCPAHMDVAFNYL